MSQKSYPEPKIESISNTGLIKIVFSTKMLVSINEMQQVLNQTFSIENKTYNAAWLHDNFYLIVNFH